MSPLYLKPRTQQVLRAYAETGMNALAAARREHVSDHTVRYHLDRVREQTGLNPRNFYELVALMRGLGAL